MQASKTIGLVRQPLEAGSIAPGLTTATIIVAVMMSACFVALSHDDSYLGSTKEKSVERGVGLKQHAKFEKDVNAAPPQRKIAFLVLLGVAGYCLLTHRRGVSFSFGPTAIMMLSCLLLVVASLLWSIDRGETGKEIVRILAYFFIAAAIAMRLRPRELCFVLATMGVASTLIALGAEIVTGHFRPWSNGYRLNGTLHSNVLASHAMFAALISFAFLQTSKRPLLLATVVLAMLAVIFLTKTRGALATTGRWDRDHFFRQEISLRRSFGNDLIVVDDVLVDVALRCCRLRSPGAGERYAPHGTFRGSDDANGSLATMARAVAAIEGSSLDGLRLRCLLDRRSNGGAREKTTMVSGGMHIPSTCRRF